MRFPQTSRAVLVDTDKAGEKRTTELLCQGYQDQIMVLITQTGKVGTFIQVIVYTADYTNLGMCVCVCAQIDKKTQP